LQSRIAAAMKAGHLPQQDVTLSSSALVGALLEGLLGPLAPDADGNPAQTREAVQTLTLLSLRALGGNDARARGLVVQVALPAIGVGAYFLCSAYLCSLSMRGSTRLRFCAECVAGGKRHVGKSSLRSNCSRARGSGDAGSRAG